MFSRVWCRLNLTGIMTLDLLWAKNVEFSNHFGACDDFHGWRQRRTQTGDETASSCLHAEVILDLMKIYNVQDRVIFTPHSFRDARSSVTSPRAVSTRSLLTSPLSLFLSLSHSRHHSVTSSVSCSHSKRAGIRRSISGVTNATIFCACARSTHFPRPPYQHIGQNLLKPSFTL